MAETSCLLYHRFKEVSRGNYTVKLRCTGCGKIIIRAIHESHIDSRFNIINSNISSDTICNPLSDI